MKHPALIPEMLLCSLRYLLLKAIAAVFLVAFLPWAGLAQEKGPDSPSLKPKPKLKLKTLAAFKNGLGFCVKTGQVTLRDGWATVDELPSASLGALWVGTDAKNGSVTDLVADKTKLAEEIPALSQAELLAANVGQRIRVTYASGTTTTIVDGLLLGVPVAKREERATADVASASSWRPPVEPGRPGEIVLIRTSVNDQVRILSLNSSLIQSVEFAEGAKLKTSVEREVNRARIRIPGADSAEVSLACLEKGIVWSPAYRVLLDSEKTAEITLDAVLANDVEDIENAEVSFVVGYPNFLYADLLSPLSLHQTVASFIQSLSSERRPEQYSRFANTMAVVIGRADASDSGMGNRDEIRRIAVEDGVL